MLSDCNLRQDIRYTQWLILLLAILAIKLYTQGLRLQQQGLVARDWVYSLAAGFCETATPRLLRSQLNFDGFDALLQQWIQAQLRVTDNVGTLVTGGKTLRGSINQNVSGAVRFYRLGEPVLQQRWGVVIAQNKYASGFGGEIAALRQLLNRVELNGLLVKADALHAKYPFPRPRAAWRRLPVDAILPHRGTW